MVIKMTECGTTAQNLLKDFGDYPYLDEFIEALLNGRTEVRCLEMGVVFGGSSYRLCNAGQWNKVACDKCLSDLKRVAKKRRRIIRDGGYVNWNPFEHELFIYFDAVPSVTVDWDNMKVIHKY